ncbi:MAG: GNAT family N-acetyltransferase [Chloroflexi bacterium]|nr:GNAT family N-acetyltransferase [Chloroflexota bacterium]
MSNSITIRIATSADNELLAEIGAQTFYATFAVDNTPADMQAYLAASFSPDIQARELADPQSIFLIAEIDGDTVGYAQLRQNHIPSCVTGARPIEIGRLYARKQWHGRGVGAALMRACLAHATRQNSDTLWLDVWEHNPRAIAFYRAWGFTQVGTQAFQLGDDLQNDFVMQRPVTPTAFQKSLDSLTT